MDVDCLSGRLRLECPESYWHTRWNRPLGSVEAGLPVKEVELGISRSKGSIPVRVGTTKGMAWPWRRSSLEVIVAPVGDGERKKLPEENRVWGLSWLLMVPFGMG